MKPTALLSLPGAEEPEAAPAESWDAALLQPAAAIASAEATAVNATTARRERNRIVKEVLPGGSGPMGLRTGRLGREEWRRGVSAARGQEERAGRPKGAGEGSRPVRPIGQKPMRGPCGAVRRG